MDRETLRREVLARRQQLSREDLIAKSERIVANFFQLAEFKAARTLMFYASFKSEVQTTGAIKRCLQAGKRVALPLTVAPEKMLRPYLIKDPERELQPGYCAIPEPDPKCTELIDPGTLDLVVIPGSVFDLRGGRLGYGGGFYDRFLADQAPAACRVALAFALQVVGDELPLQPHDQSIDCLVTEERTWRFGRADR